MNENGEMVPAGVPGELCTRGKIVGYIGTYWENINCSVISPFHN